MSRRPRRPSRSTLAAQEARIRAAHAIALQRANPSWSLSRAAREAHTTVPTVRRHMPTAVNRDTRGHWHATPADRERFTMSVTTVEHGTVPLTVAGSRKRALVGAHHAAINTYLATGNQQRLDALRGKTVAGLTLQTDPSTIRQLFRQGELSFLEIYALAS